MGWPTVWGGGHAAEGSTAPHALTATEHAAVQSALAKLAPAGTTTTTNLTGGSTTLPLLKTFSAGSGLVAGAGNDTYAGGVSSANLSLSTFASDTVIGGSSAVTPAVGHSGAALQLSADTISVTGATASGVKALDPAQVPAGHTITLSDKTTLNITGVSHDIKPTSH